MRKKAARFGVTLAVAGALATGTLAAATPASATATGWTPYQALRSHNLAGVTSISISSA